MQGDSFQLLETEEKVEGQAGTGDEPHRAFKFIRNNEDLFNSHFCDEDYYVPVKKRSMSFEFDEEEGEKGFGKAGKAGKEGQGRGKGEAKKEGNNRGDNKYKANPFSKNPRAPDTMASVISPPSKKRQTRVSQSALQLRHLGESEQNNQRPKLIKKSNCSIQLINSKYYIQLEGISVPVNEQTLKFMEEELHKLNLCVPIFSIRRLQEWEGSSIEARVSEDDETHRLFKCSLTKYLEYLYERHPLELREVFNDPALRKRLQIAHKPSFWKLQFLNQAFSNIKGYIYTSKLQILQKTLLTKSRSFSEARRQLKKWYELGDLMHSLVEEERHLWGQIEDLQFMICLEETERYCEQKIREGKEGKQKEYWSNYRSVIKRELERERTAIVDIGM